MDFRLKDPEDMTPEERLQRIVEILSDGVVRLIRKKQEEKACAAAAQPAIADSSTSSCVAVAASEPKKLPESLLLKRGRVPFGQRKLGEDRTEHKSEQVWVQRIGELAAKGYSSEKIAQRLNREDRESKRAGKWSRVAVWRILKGLEHRGVTK
ncbi:MAG: recombinase family protein [Elusimicrobia bacterium]|nr:recombinase family protein [Elusimicrobiota bacterium]